MVTSPPIAVRWPPHRRPLAHAADLPGGELAALLERAEYSGWHLLPEAAQDEAFDPDD